MKTKNPLILIIRDGWGYNPKKENNFIKMATTPNEDRYLKKYPHSLLKTSGEAVGLGKGYQGNSEVGHLTLGAGRIIFQALTRINKSIVDGSFFENQELLKVIQHCREKKTKLHLLGLLQTQGVHSHLNHLLAILDLCQRQKFTDVVIHVITDGRDAPVTESLKHLKTLVAKIKKIGFGEIVSISGRYYALDRDKRWGRTKKAYQAIIEGRAPEFDDLVSEVKRCHHSGETDEFIVPKKLKGYSGLKKNDGLIFFNFRTDRTRQLSQSIVEKNFSGFVRKYLPVKFVAMTQYYKEMKAGVAFPPLDLKNLLGETISRAGLRQLRISETEKYAHVTFFFNGQKEKPSRGEDRALIPSPRVATYDQLPEMSVYKIAQRLVSEIKKKYYDFIVVNLVNCDMVGHTAKPVAIRTAVEAVDTAQGKIVEAALDFGYSCLLLADHGNAENKGGATETSHTTNPVPIIFISEEKKLKNTKIISGGELSDIAPTILNILGVDIPLEMTGKILLK